MSDYQLIDPQSSLDFKHDWSDFLADGDSVASQQWTIAPLNDGSPTTPTLTNATAASVTVSGCEAGKVYHLTEHIVTAVVEADRTIVIRCENR